MYSNQRSSSAAGRSNGANGVRPGSKIGASPSRNYLNPTNSSVGHSKGGSAAVLAKLNASGSGSVMHKRPPSTGGKPPRPADLSAANVAAHDIEDANHSNNNNNDYGNCSVNGTNNSPDRGSSQFYRPPSQQGGNNSSLLMNSAARTVYRPSAILIDKVVHGQHPPLAPIDPVSAANSPARSAVNGGQYQYSVGRPGSSAMRGGGGDGQPYGDFKPSSAAYGGGVGVNSIYNPNATFNTTNASNMSTGSMLPASVGAKDLLRFKETLKLQSPSAMALEANRQQLLADQERERIAKLEFREQWRMSVEEQLRFKEQRRQEERERGRKERTVIEDRFLEEKATALAKKRQMASEIQQQKYDDELRAAAKAQESVERAREERAQMDATVRQMHKEKFDSRVNKVMTQREILAHANMTQQMRLDERLRQDTSRKLSEREMADAAKEAEVRESIQIRADQKHRQREVLEQSRQLSNIKHLNDSRAQMEYEAALEAQKRMVEDRDARERKEAAEAKARLAYLLKNQMNDRQEARTAERKRTIEQQRQAADDERRAAEREREAEKQLRLMKQAQLQHDLEIQMNNNMNKTLVDLVHN